MGQKEACVCQGLGAFLRQVGWMDLAMMRFNNTYNCGVPGRQVCFVPSAHSVRNPYLALHTTATSYTRIMKASWLGHLTRCGNGPRTSRIMCFCPLCPPCAPATWHPHLASPQGLQFSKKNPFGSLGYLCVGPLHEPNIKSLTQGSRTEVHPRIPVSLMDGRYAVRSPSSYRPLALTSLCRPVPPFYSGRHMANQ